MKTICNFMMESTMHKRTILPKFSNTTLGIIIRGRMRERERGGEFKGKRETIGNWRERRERQMEWSNDQKAQVGLGPRPMRAGC